LWRTADKASDAAEALKVTAADLLRLGVIDQIVPEPIGGAQRDPAEAIATLGGAITGQLEALASETPAALLEQRRAKFLSIG